MRLDDLQALVHQRCRVDGDLPAHLPGWVAQRGVGIDMFESRGGVVAEGATGGSQDETPDLGPRSSVQTLMESDVLAVDREDVDAPAMCGIHHELSRHDEHFLVRERNRLPCLN